MLLLIVQTFFQDSTVSNGEVEEGVAIFNNTLLFIECVQMCYYVRIIMRNNNKILDSTES